MDGRAPRRTHGWLGSTDESRGAWPGHTPRSRRYTHRCHWRRCSRSIRAAPFLCTRTRPSGVFLMVDSSTFKSVLSRLASGVSVVTTVSTDGRDHGMTVSALCALSLDPPLVLLCVDKKATMYTP